MKQIKNAPLSSGFMVASIIGFFVSIWLVADYSEAWAFAFAFVFVLMFIASIISMSKTEAIPYHMSELAMHEMHNSPKPPKKKRSANFNNLKWYDGAFFVYLVVITYFIIESLRLSDNPTNPTIFLILAVSVIVTVLWLIVDALSSEELMAIQQFVFVFLLVLTGPIGMFVYYYYRRLYLT